MPPKRQNIGRRTNEAKRQRLVRQNETEEERAQRIFRNRLQTSQSRARASESSDQWQGQSEIPKLVPFLTKEVKLTCCNTFARVQDCIPGTVLCPNVDCNVPLEFSWCKKVVCYPERNPRNHCSFCGQCCFSNGRHCLTCNRCYVATPKLPYCPTCQEKTSIATLKDMETNFYNCDTKDHDDPPKSVTKSVQKPEIVILDVYSLSKTSFKTENADESTNFKRSADGDDSTIFEDYTKSQDSKDSAITID